MFFNRSEGVGLPQAPWLLYGNNWDNNKINGFYVVVRFKFLKLVRDYTDPNDFLRKTGKQFPTVMWLVRKPYGSDKFRSSFFKIWVSAK